MAAFDMSNPEAVVSPGNRNKLLISLQILLLQ
jgi:hypothetical protein